MSHIVTHQSTAQHFTSHASPRESVAHRRDSGWPALLSWRTTGCFSDTACFVFQDAFVKPTNSRSNSLRMRYLRAEWERS